ncbi:MAG: ABC transporter permease [Bacteroidetes bacterium]|nr:ABC transporter permease [Bacteroidota bacterium]
MFERYIYILNIALEAVFLNKFRSMLTALGIIFGVAAVIAMMAIGRGAQKDILDQMKLVGVNNIVISSKTEKKSSSDKSSNSSSSQNQSQNQSDSKQSSKFSPGLTLLDAVSIKQLIPTVDKVCPETIYEVDVIKDSKRSTLKLTGTNPDFFSVFNLNLVQGEMFNEEQLVEGKPVCIIGNTIKSHFFPKQNPIGKEIKCGPIWLTVIGVLSNREVNEQALENLGISDYNNTIYTPIQTLLLRYKDRSLVTRNTLQGQGGYWMRGSYVVDEGDAEKNSRNQVDKIVVQIRESKQVKPTTEVLRRMMIRRHAGVEDIEIKVPELLLKNEERTRNIFNMVLGAIASISLLIGGIGIMNIMLASVMERIKEIGIRQAIGATKRDIILQFLTEATLISVTGGLIGIILGIVLSKLIMGLTSITTIVSPLSVILSFGVSATVGIAFGFMPARRASQQEPVASLRHE